MRRPGLSAVLTAALGTVLAGALVVPADAAPPLTLVSSTPANGSTVASAPTIAATFSAALNPATVSVSVKMTGNVTVPTSSPVLSNSNKTVTVTPNSTLADSSYTVNYSVDSATGSRHLSTAVLFTVSSAVVVPPPPAPTIADVSLANVDAVPISGTVTVSGGTVHVVVSDTNGHTATANPAVVASSWSTTIDLSSQGQPLDDGTLSAVATQSDANGNESAPSSADTAVKDTVAPAAPSNIAFDAPAVNGDPVVVLSGSGENGATVQISVNDTDGSTAALVPADASVSGGSWSKSIDVSDLTDGTLTATVTQTDGLGNVSPDNTATVQKDVVNPDAPTAVVFNAPASISHTTVTLSGSGEPDATVTYSVDDGDDNTTAKTGTATVLGDGTWAKSIDVSTLSDGTLTATVSQTDGVGNSSGNATAMTDKDTVAPGAPTNLGVDGPANSGDTTVRITGDGEDGATASVSVDDDGDANTPQVTRTAPVAGGTWFVDVPVGTLDDGTLTATVTQVDGVGNVSDAATPLPVVKDTVVPAAPSALAFDEPAKNGDTDVLLSGTGENGDTVTISVDDVGNASTGPVTDQVTVASGVWQSHSLALAALDDGTLTATVTQTDAVGNESTTTTKTVLKDVVVPVAPAAPAVDDANAANQGAVPVTGTTAESGGKVKLAISDGTTTVFSGLLNVSGTSWSTTIDVTGLIDGPITVQVVQLDAVGNVSLPSTAGSAKKDVVVPNAPSGLAFDGVVKGSDTVVVLSGSGETGATVAIVVNDADSGTPAFVRQATVAGGAWSKSMDLSVLTDGTLTATVTQTDAVGNTSNPASKNVLKDTIALAPSPMAFDHPANDINNGFVHLEGSGEPGADVEVRVNDESTATPVVLPNFAVVVDDTGSWSAELYLSGLQDGSITGRARQTDKRGNVSPWAEATTIKDTSKPPAPTITGPTARWTIGSTRVSWKGTTARYDVGFLEAFSGDRLGSKLLLPSTMQNVSGTSLLRLQPLGTTDCYSVRAHDAAGNRSFWTEQRCSSRPYDDRKLNPSGSWSKVTGTEFWQGTARRTKSKGAKLALGNTGVKRIALVATTCDNCGRLAVTVGGVRVGVFDLHSSHTRHHRVLKLTLTTLRTGRVLLTTLSRRLVEVDGFGVTRV